MHGSVFHEIRVSVSDTRANSSIHFWGASEIRSGGPKYCEKKLMKRLLKEGISPSSVDIILFETLNPLQAHYEQLKTSYRRKKKYKELFPYVEPQRISIDRERESYFYYVPIEETLKAVLCDKSLNLDLKAAPEPHGSILTDFTDGYVFQRNKFFQDNPCALRLILYQDGFEMVDPLGPAKGKHKMIGVYLSIGNLPDYIRSHIFSIQLVALCKEKDFKHSVVFGKIVQDLLRIQAEGINSPSHGLVKAGLVFITGDNLGSHGLGGFVENFSKSTYFCRYCIIDRPAYFSEHGFFLEFAERTVESYEAALQGKNTTTKKGIKFNSKFNLLPHFHVCNPGLPPCFGHDIFEGFAAFDIALIIHHLVEKEWFMYEDLKVKMDSFPYSPEDRRDEPKEFKEDSEKVKGGAWQVWTFLKLFPLMVEEYIKDSNEPAWKCLTILIEVIEIICAPSIHCETLPYLKNLIYDYLDLRSELFPDIPLRPKHHYLVHYPDLIAAFGPLIKVWTMRFESKHTFFNRTSRATHNFINIMKSLSNRHELYQSFIRSGAELRCVVKVFDVAIFKPQVYCEGLQVAAQSIPSQGEVSECTKVEVKGTLYKKGSIVVVRQDGYQSNVVLGRVVVILFDCADQVFFLLEIIANEFKPHIRTYSIGPVTGYESVACHELLSFYPLSTYRVNGASYVRLKHAQVSKFY